MTRWVKHWIASAMLSMSIVGATVGLSYGQDKMATGTETPQVADASVSLGLIPKQIKISDVTRRFGS